jgi:hypothetical protein
LHYAVTVGLFALAAGLIAPTSSPSEDMIARQQAGSILQQLPTILTIIFPIRSD